MRTSTWKSIETRCCFLFTRGNWSQVFLVELSASGTHKSVRSFGAAPWKCIVWKESNFKVNPISERWPVKPVTGDLGGSRRKWQAVGCKTDCKESQRVTLTYTLAQMYKWNQYSTTKTHRSPIQAGSGMNFAVKQTQDLTDILTNRRTHSHTDIKL